MTNQEAIETLKANYPDACYEQLREAVDTAISALQAQDDWELDFVQKHKKIPVELSVSAQSEPCEDVFALDDFIKELDIAIKQDGHDIYIKADGAKMLKGLLRNQMGDSISRQAVIDAITQIKRTDNWKAAACMVIYDLPSAQPEIIRCKDCEYGTQDEYGRWYCRSFGYQIGDEDGSGSCVDAERRKDG